MQASLQSDPAAKSEIIAGTHRPQGGNEIEHILIIDPHACGRLVKHENGDPIASGSAWTRGRVSRPRQTIVQFLRRRGLAVWQDSPFELRIKVAEDCHVEWIDGASHDMPFAGFERGHARRWDAGVEVHALRQTAWCVTPDIVLLVLRRCRRDTRILMPLKNMKFHGAVLKF